MTTPESGREAPAVPEVSDHLAWWQHAELFVLLRVVGPWRRRRNRPAMPPPLTAEETARRLFALPINYWTYDFEPGVRHLGPMSQDFAAAFGLGNTNRKIHIVDANGVAVVAMQVLNRKVVALQREVDRLTARLEVGDRSPDVSSAEQINPLRTTSLEQDEATGPHQSEENTMSENQNPQIGTTDDVVAHGFSGRGLVDPEPEDDAEGHVIRGKLVEDDVEGHAGSASRIEADDVEGHGLSSTRGATSGRGALSGRVRPDEEEMFGQDVEGHGFSGRGLVDPEPPDVQGHGTVRGGLVEDESGDVEGHRAYPGSDVNTKHDVMPVESEDGDDAEGHSMRGKLVEDDVEGHAGSASRFDADDVEGHAVRGNGLVEDEDDAEGHGYRGNG